MSKGKILFVSHEMAPFLELSDLAQRARKLPQRMQENGWEIRALMPRFGVINERRNRLHEVIRLSGMNIVVDDTDNPLIIKVASIPAARMQVYFLDNEEFFQRKSVFATKDGKFHADNDIRTIFFCLGVIETVRKFGWNPDVVHCQGWMTSLVPFYLKTLYKNDPLFRDTKVVFTASDENFNGSMGKSFHEKIVNGYPLNGEARIFEPADSKSLQKGAISYSDAIIQGTPELDAEIKEAIKSSGKPVLNYQNEEEYLDSYAEFYETLAPVGELEEAGQ